MAGILLRLRQHLAQEGDTEQDTARKTFASVLAPAVAALLLFTGANSAVGDSPQWAYVSGSFVGSAVLWLATVYVLRARRISLRKVEGCLLSLTACVMCMDWANAAEPGTVRLWAYVVLVMDVALVVVAHRWVQNACLHGTALWLVISSAEDALRLGLYDIEGWSQPSEAKLKDRTDCGDPPCATGINSGVLTAFAYISLLYFDFFATRNFAEGQRRERERVHCMIRLAEQVADCLARFDLESAESRLGVGADQMTTELGSSFRKLLANLGRYRPYLPQSCFEEGDVWETDEESYESDGGTPTAHARQLGASARHQRESTGPNRNLEKRDSEQPSSSTPSPSALRRDTAHSVGQTMSASRSRLNESRRSANRSFRDPGASPLPSDGLSSGSPSFCSLPTVEEKRGTGNPRAAHAALHKRVTLLNTNRTCFLAAFSQSKSELVSFFAAEVERFSVAVNDQKGVVDLLSGDHLNANFGRGMVCTAAVCTGQATCGDFGSTATQRFMVIGGVSSFAVAAERVASAWGTAVLVDSDVEQDAKMHWCCRLRKLVRFPKRTDRPIGLWEVRSERKVDSEELPQEWMYQMTAQDEATPNPWDTYNQALLLWSKGHAEPAREKLRVVTGSPSLIDPPQEVVSALQALASALTDESVKPLCDLDAAASVGAPVPVGDARSDSPDTRCSGAVGVLDATL